MSASVVRTGRTIDNMITTDTRDAVACQEHRSGDAVRHDLEKGTVTGRPLLCGLDDPEKQLVSENFFRETLLVPEHGGLP